MAEMFEDEDHSSLYVQFRPSVPESIIEKLIHFCSQNHSESKLDLAIDVGCGSGQCTKMLSPFFNKVLGVDISKSQIKEAQQLQGMNLENTEFFVGSEECFPVNAHSVDLVVSSTALHWFDLTQYYREVDRVLRPGTGVMASISYKDPVVINSKNDAGATKAFENLINMLNKADIITDQVKHWEEEYDNVPKIHYKEHFSYKYDNFIWTASLADLIGLVQSFALFQQFEKKMGKRHSENLINDFYKSIKKALDEPEKKDPAEIRLQYNFRFYFHATRKDA